jgi:hypothetical protein
MRLGLATTEKFTKTLLKDQEIPACLPRQADFSRRIAENSAIYLLWSCVVH